MNICFTNYMTNYYQFKGEKKFCQISFKCHSFWPFKLFGNLMITTIDKFYLKT